MTRQCCLAGGVKWDLHGCAEEAQAPVQALGPHVAALGMRFWSGEPLHSASSGLQKRHTSHLPVSETSLHRLFCLLAECTH